MTAAIGRSSTGVAAFPASVNGPAQGLTGDQWGGQKSHDASIILTAYDLPAIWICGRTAIKHLVRTPKNIGHAHREARKAKNLTQSDLASLSGVWQETISRIENGSDGARLETIFALIAALDLELTVTERSKGESERLEHNF